MRIEDRLNKATTAVEREIGTIPMRPVGVVQGRHRHQRMLATASATALLLTLLVGSAFLFTGTAGEPVVTVPTETVPAAAALATELVPSDLEWQVFDATISNWKNAFAWEDTFYALSTAPGKAEPDPNQDYSEVHYRVPQAIYSSTDGIAWDAELISDDLWVSHMDHHEGTLYAVGTAPGVSDSRNGPIEAQAAFTTDGGATWEHADLPVSAVPPDGMGSVMYRALSAKIAAGPAGIVAVVNTRFHMNYSQFVPDEYRFDEYASNTTSFVYRTDDGVAVADWSTTQEAAIQEAAMACDDALRQLREEGATITTAPPTTVPSAEQSTTTVELPSDIEVPAECEVLEELSLGAPEIVFEATWEELGVAEPPVTFFSEMFVSADGRSWDVVSSPFGGDGWIDIYASEDGFLGVEEFHSLLGADTELLGAETEWRIWSSPDGRTWERLNLPDGLSRVTSLGTVGDRIVVVGKAGTDRPTPVSVFVSENGGMSWESVDLSFLPEAGDESRHMNVSTAHIGPHGLVLALHTEPMSEGSESQVSTTRVVMTEDFTAWSEVPLEDIGVGPNDVFVFGVLNTGDRALMSATWHNEGHGDYATLVGTEG